MSKRVLITGSAGFIGSKVTHQLIESGYEVLGVDSFSDYYSRDYKEYRLDYFGINNLIYHIDITSKAELDSVFNSFRPHILIHLAAQGGVRAGKAKPWPYISTNQLGFLNVLQLSEQYSLEKFVYASSSSVYGDGLVPPYRESDPLPEPKSLYAISKMANEVIARDLPSSGLQRIGLRLFTVYGPLGRPDMAVFRLLASSILGKSFHLTANLNVQRDFTYVDDVSKMIEGMCKAISLPPIINVAGSNPFSLGELLKILEDQKIEVDVLREDEDPLDSKVTHGSTETIRQYNLDVPQTHLRDGIQRTWEWMKSVDRRKIREWYESSL